MSAATSPLLPELKVERDWYVKRNASAREAILRTPTIDLNHHFLSEGQQESADPNPLFMVSHYVKASGFERRAPGVPICEDYIRNSGRLKASANWLFDEARFQRMYPAVADAVGKRNWISAYLYYLRQAHADDFSPHSLFIPRYYRNVAELRIEDSAFKHYMNVGQFSGLSPTPLFDPEFYLAENNISDHIGIGHQYISPLHHFVEKGMRLGFSPIADFDANFYLARYPDVKKSINDRIVSSAFEHFLVFGRPEARQPNEYFSPEDYKWYNPQIGAEVDDFGFSSVFEHFLAFGARRGLRAHKPAHSISVPESHSKGIFEQRARISAQLFCHEGLDFPVQESPLISFILPVRDNFVFTMSLLGQLHQAALAAPRIPIEVVVVDNGSSDRTVRLDDYVRGLQIIRDETSRGYTLACNRGAAEAKGEILVFLNNDIELTPHLLDRVARSLADPSVAITGPRVVNAAGRLQEAGSILWADGSAAGFGRGDDPTLPIYLAPRDVDYLSGCFLCVRRSVFSELGGFDVRFAPGYYEDTDLCLQARLRGHRVVYDPSMVIYHYEYASYSRGRPPSSSAQLMRAKRLQFVQKNRDALERQPRMTEFGVVGAAFDRFSRTVPPRVLIIEDRVPSHVSGSGFGRTEDVIRSLTQGGALVSVWVLHQRVEADVPEWTKGAWSILPTREGPDKLVDYLNQYGNGIDVIWVCRTHNFRAHRHALAAWRRARAGRKLIVDTEAIASLRDAALQALCGLEPSPADLKQAIQAEISDLSVADKVVVVNRVDADAVREAFGLEATILGHQFRLQPTPASFAERRGIAFLGALYGANTPNYDSLRWFIEEVFPIINKAMPDVEFHVAGYLERAVPQVRSPFDKQIIWRGEVKDLESFFGATRVFVAPTRYAGGIPHKVEHAASFGVPAVVTALLAAQLDSGSGEHFCLSPKDATAKAYADCVIRLYQDAALWAKLREMALQHVKRNCDAELFGRTVLDLAENG